VIGERAVSLETLQHRSGLTPPNLNDSKAYLAGLPESEQARANCWPGAKPIWRN